MGVWMGLVREVGGDSEVSYNLSFLVTLALSCCILPFPAFSRLPIVVLVVDPFTPPSWYCMRETIQKQIRRFQLPRLPKNMSLYREITAIYRAHDFGESRTYAKKTTCATKSLR